MKNSAIAILLDVKESVEESDYLPEEAENTVLVAKVVTSFVRGFIGCIRCIGLREFVSATVVTEIVAVVVLVSECINCYCVSVELFTAKVTVNYKVV